MGWWVFIPTVIVCSLVSMFSRGAMNQRNMQRSGAEVDYRRDCGASPIRSPRDHSGRRANTRQTDWIFVARVVEGGCGIWRVE